ncbi:hypothetical protein B0H19DRAFT_1298089 [Mycena capillaripes]|nr:hypothetical protein B0H19DRAFT_1298089 [Mycena capillaripes]
MSTISTPGSAPSPDVSYSTAPTTALVHGNGGRFAFEAPLPLGPPSPSSSGGWDWPATPPASAGIMGMHTGLRLGMSAQMTMQMHLDAAPMKEYFAAAHPGSTGAGAGAAYDLGLGLDGEESLLLGGGARMNTIGIGWAGVNPSHPTSHLHQQHAQQAIQLREMYQQAVVMGGAPLQIGIQMGMNAVMGMGMQVGARLGVFP